MFQSSRASPFTEVAFTYKQEVQVSWAAAQSLGDVSAQGHDAMGHVRIPSAGSSAGKQAPWAWTWASGPRRCPAGDGRLRAGPAACWVPWRQADFVGKVLRGGDLHRGFGV